MKKNKVGRTRGRSHNTTEPEVAQLQQDIIFLVTQHITQQYSRLTGCVTAVGLIDGVPRRFSALCCKTFCCPDATSNSCCKHLWEGKMSRWWGCYEGSAWWWWGRRTVWSIQTCSVVNRRQEPKYGTRLHTFTVCLLSGDPYTSRHKNKWEKKVEPNSSTT